MIRLRILTCGLLVLTLWAGSIAPAAASEDPAAGFIYATVTWPSGESKTGFLRWRGEEAFWDDTFECGYRELVWADHADLEQLRKQRREEYYARNNLLKRLIYAMDEDDDNPLGMRVLVSRMGDLRSIEIHDGEDDFAFTADGGRHQVGGYGNDAGSRLVLYVAGEAPEEIRWNDLTNIEFKPAPAGAVPYAERLYGTVKSTEGDYEGFIQWDRSECTTTDVLDGEDDGQDVEIPMGEIQSISRARGNGADVVLHDGTRRRLTDSNDVNSSNRGIMVEVAELGRVTVPWSRFKSVTFIPGKGSGPARATFANAIPLRGEITDTEGRRLAGRLVFDLEEAWVWDIYNGTDSDGFDYAIPFGHIARLEPQSGRRCEVILRDGRTLKLGGDQDTGDDNAGVLVFVGGSEDAEHVAWGRIRSIVFDE